MTRHAPPLRVVVAVAALALATSARADGSACDAIVAALLRLTQTPSHVTLSETTSYTQGARLIETVTRGNERWIRVRGRWVAAPFDAAAEATELRTRFHDESGRGRVSCTRIGDEAVAGEAAAVYATHQVLEGGTSDTRTWVSTPEWVTLSKLKFEPKGPKKVGSKKISS